MSSKSGGPLTLFMIEFIRRIPWYVAAPVLINLVMLPTNRGNGHSERSIVDKVPHRSVSNILVALDPSVGWVSHPRRHRHDQGIDAGIRPLVQVGPFVLRFFELKLGHA